MSTYKNLHTFEQFIEKYYEPMNENSREKLPSETSPDAETPTSRENKDLEDIRFFRGSLQQWNEYLAKRIKEEGGEPNPNKNMIYLHPIDRKEQEADFISYQDFINGKSIKSQYLSNIRRPGYADGFRYPS
jgi:hypothetical protein